MGASLSSQVELTSSARRFKRQMFVSLDLSSAQVDLLALERHAVAWIDERLRDPQPRPNGIVGVEALSLESAT